MTDDRPPEGTTPAELQPVISRLQEIHRKCLSLGPRNEEAQEMAVRLEEILDKLSRPTSDDRPPPSYGQLAGQLFPVARLFESLGFITVAREIAHVEKSLRELDPEAELVSQTTPDVMSTARTAEATTGFGEGPLDTDDEPADEPPARAGIPRPVAIGLLAVLIAILASIVLVRWQETRHEQPAPDSLSPTSTVDYTATVPAPATAVASTPVASIGDTPTPGPRARLASLVGESRLALRRGDIDSAISLLSQAALIDNDATTVLDTADSLVADLVGRADRAADNAEWEAASQFLERARELAIRFELSTRPIDAAKDRHARLERYDRLLPSETGAIRAAAGRRVLVLARDDTRYAGRIHDVAGGVLQLHQGIDVAGDGTLFHVDEIPLNDIREIRVYPE